MLEKVVIAALVALAGAYLAWRFLRRSGSACGCASGCGCCDARDQGSGCCPPSRSLDPISGRPVVDRKPE